MSFGFLLSENPPCIPESLFTIPDFPSIDSSILILEALSPMFFAIAALFWGLSSLARKHNALTDVESFVDADINLYNCYGKCNKQIIKRQI